MSPAFRATLFAIFFLILATVFPKPDLTIPYRALSTFLHPYSAPSIGCTCHDTIPKKYCVGLHRGTFFEDHNRTVLARQSGDPINFMFITRVLLSNIIGPSYCAENVEDTVIEAMQRDIAVDWIACEREGPDDPFFDVVEEIDLSKPNYIFQKGTKGPDVCSVFSGKWYEPSFLGSWWLGEVRDWVKVCYRHRLMDLDDGFRRLRYELWYRWQRRELRRC